VHDALPVELVDYLAAKRPEPGTLMCSNQKGGWNVHASALNPIMQRVDAVVTRWWKALAERDGIPVRALDFVALTAARAGEVRGMKWQDVDLVAGIWTVPGDRMKAGRAYCLLRDRDGAGNPQGSAADGGGPLRVPRPALRDAL
jgi:hypothetical protein